MKQNKKKKSKICFFVGDMSKNGGTERVSSIIANELLDRGYQIIFLSYKKCDKSFYFLNSEIKIYSLFDMEEKGYFKRKIRPYINLYKFVKKANIDVMIDVDIILSLYTIPIKILCGIKNISWEHFNFSNQRVKNRVRARKLAGYFSDAIVTLNKRDLENYKKNLNRIKRIDYIYNPAIVENANVTTLKNNIAISVGRLNYSKGFDNLLKIWKLVEEKNKNWKLLIIGDGEERDNLKKIINEYKLQNVFLLPFQKNIEYYYENASIYVMTSRSEGFPMVLLEAQKKGLPIISFDCETGPSEIVIDGRNGYLIKQNNLYEFANKLLEIMNDNKKIIEFSKNAIKDSERFELKQIVNKWVELLETL